MEFIKRVKNLSLEKRKNVKIGLALGGGGADDTSSCFIL